MERIETNERSRAESCVHVLRGLISYHERMTMGNYQERDFYLDALQYALSLVENESKEKPESNGFTPQDFISSETNDIIKEKIFPALDEIARKEFPIVTMCGLPVEEDDVEDIAFSVMKIEELISCYLRSLAQMHINFGQLYAGLENCDRDGLDGKLDEFINRHRGERLTT